MVRVVKFIDNIRNKYVQNILIYSSSVFGSIVPMKSAVNLMSKFKEYSHTIDWTFSILGLVCFVVAVLGFKYMYEDKYSFSLSETCMVVMLFGNGCTFLLLTLLMLGSMIF